MFAHLFDPYEDIVSINKTVLSMGDMYPNQTQFCLMQSTIKRVDDWKQVELTLAVLGFSFLFFTVIGCPFELAWVSSKFQRALFAFA